MQALQIGCLARGCGETSLQVQIALLYSGLHSSPNGAYQYMLKGHHSLPQSYVYRDELDRTTLVYIWTSIVDKNDRS